MNDKILLLGSTGFLGKRIARRLSEEGRLFIPVSRTLGTDLRDFRQFEQVFTANLGIDVILHAATFVGGIKFGLEHPAEIYYNNALINANLFELACRHKIRRIINPIPNCSYPRDIYPEFREDLWWEGPLDESVMVYGFIRKGGWIQSWAYYKQYGLETISLIVPNMYGPEDHFDEVRSHALGALIMKITRAKINNDHEVIVWGTGKPVREWLYVDDCVEAMIRAIDITHNVEPINIGIGTGVSIKGLAEMIKQEVGYEGDLVYDTSKPDGAPHKVMNIDRCKQILKWWPNTSLKDGISKTVKWYIDNIQYKN